MKTRIISAVIMALIIVPIVLFGGIALKIGMGILTILAYREIISLKKYPKGVIVTGLISILLMLYNNMSELFIYTGINYGYVMLVFLLMFIPCLFYYRKNTYNYKDALTLTGFILFIGIMLNILMNICTYKFGYFIMILMVTILTDTFAYFTGMMIGKHKVSKISPKKSLEGFIGGAVMGSIITCIYYVNFIHVAPLYIAFPLILLMSLACEAGDLFYSVIKRNEDIKDFSNLIPGHGGILDRIDSTTFVTAVYIILSSIL